MRDAARSASAGGRATGCAACSSSASSRWRSCCSSARRSWSRASGGYSGSDLGFNPASVLTARLWLPQPNDPATGPYFTHDARVAFYRRVLDRVAALPGVQSAGGVTQAAARRRARAALSFSIEGRAAGAGDAAEQRSPRSSRPATSARSASISSAAGCSTTTTTGARRSAAVVSESFTRQFFPGEDPIGKRVAPARARAAPASQQRRRTGSRSSGSSGT